MNKNQTKNTTPNLLKKKIIKKIMVLGIGVSLIIAENFININIKQADKIMRDQRC